MMADIAPLGLLHRTGLVTFKVNASFLPAAELIALLPVAVVALLQRGLLWVFVLITAIATTLVWQIVFSLVRKKPIPLDGLATGLAFALVLPPEIALWQVMLAQSFATIAGEQVFGGRGYSFVHPAIFALAFLLFSFPGLQLAHTNTVFALSIIPGAILLLAVRYASWRAIVGAAIGFGLCAFLLGADSAWQALATGSVLFILVFLVCDPLVSASTNLGRLCYGFLFGILCVLLKGAAGAEGFEAAIFGGLLTMVFAPLVDQAVIAINQAMRRRRHG